MFQQRSVDRELMEMAYIEERVLLTEDKDFGWIAFVAHARSAGVVLIRFPATGRRTLPAAAIQLVADHGAELKDSFVVLLPGSVRISRSSVGE
jgi:predicted nuclease of predicted toxin-antitoxin system